MRALLVLVGFLTFFAVVVACNGSNQGPRSSLSADQAAAARQACMFGAGTLPGLSQAKNATLGSDIPLDTIVVLMMENRSFDHMLQNLPAFGQPDAEVAPAGITNPDADGTPRPTYHLAEYCFDDTSHGWTDVHTEWNHGAMDGFVIANNHNDGAPADGKRAMGFYTEQDLPFFYSLANTFALADHNFSSVVGPTFPNREYLYAATSFGHIGNDLFSDEMPTIFQELDAAKVNWHVYYTDLPGGAIFLGTLSKYFSTNTDTIPTFFDDAKAGLLGQMVFVDPKLGRGGASRDDFHPPGDVQEGEKFLSDVVQALMQSPQWKHTALIVTFDEHGGIFDHVPPPPACAPDDIAPILNPSDNAPGDFANLSVRVPLIVVSPYAKPHFVSHAVYDHTSITRFIETRFKLPALTKRDANADPLTDLFDFKKAAFATPPPLPTPTVDPQKLADCIQRYPDDGGV
ncbi:MAG TPA: alkaline phosphatase family protein, partial [Polyangia bacterium]